MITSESGYKPSLGMKFFLFCAATDEDILAQCPKSEYYKYSGVGVTVFFTGLLAFLSGGYALYTVFDSLVLSLILGFFWGTIVFNLDRFLVSTMKKSKGKTREIIQIVPRLLLAIFLSIVISKPLELRIFQQEINEKLHYTGIEKLAAIDSLYTAKFATKERQVDGLKKELNVRFEIREELYRQYKCECEGTCGTGEKGRGEECDRKEKKYAKTDQEYLALKKQIDLDVLTIKKEIASLKIERVIYQDELQSTFSAGLMARLDALSELPSGPQYAILLLLICIEIAPILVKLLSPYGPYDHILKTKEYEFEIEEITAINMRNQELNNKLTLLASVEQQKVDQEIFNNEGAMKLVANAHLEIVEEQLSIWVSKEKNKLHKEIEADEF